MTSQRRNARMNKVIKLMRANASRFDYLTHPCVIGDDTIKGKDLLTSEVNLDPISFVCVVAGIEERAKVCNSEIIRDYFAFSPELHRMFYFCPSRITEVNPPDKPMDYFNVEKAIEGLRVIVKKQNKLDKEAANV